MKVRKLSYSLDGDDVEVDFASGVVVNRTQWREMQFAVPGVAMLDILAADVEQAWPESRTPRRSQAVA